MKLEEQICEALEYANLEALDERLRASLVAESSALPPDYVEFLLKFGWGQFGMLHVYGGPSRPSWCHWKKSTEDDHLIVAGDDGSGNYYCFNSKDVNNLVIKGVDYESEQKLGITFEELILRFLNHALEGKRRREAQT